MELVHGLVALGISIHAPRKGSDLQWRRQIPVVPISIHAPRKGSDPRNIFYLGAHPKFQSTLPVRGATLLPLPVVRYLEFQSTLPSRRATNVIWCRKGAHEFQSTLPSRGATRNPGAFRILTTISIHAPLAGSDR